MLPVPPLAAVYQSKFVPVAVNTDDGPPTQRLIGVLTVGELGAGFTNTEIVARGLSQAPTDASLVWLTK